MASDDGPAAPDGDPGGLDTACSQVEGSVMGVVFGIYVLGGGFGIYVLEVGFGIYVFGVGFWGFGVRGEGVKVRGFELPFYHVARPAAPDAHPGRGVGCRV